MSEAERGGHHPKDSQSPYFLNQQHQQSKLARMKAINPISNALQEVVERHWKSLPTQAKAYLLDSSTSIDIHGLCKFWSSSPTVADYTCGLKAHDAVGASWFIALCYLKGGRLNETRALLLNGSFLRQCMNTPIESIISLCRGMKKEAPMTDYLNLPFYNHGFHSLLTQKMMEGYLHSQLSSGYQHMLQSFVKTQSDHVIGYFGNLGQDWSTGSTAKRNRRQKRLTSNESEETQIQLFVSAEGANDEGRRGFNIGSSTTLKGLFNDYAEKRGVSLRSLRFTFNDRTLFLSTVGNKTPNELNMKDQDVITVHDNNASQASDSSSSKQRDNNMAPMKKPKAKKSSSHKSKSKGKKKGPIRREEPPQITLEECKTQHSNMLSKLHEELQPRLKEIRIRLNTLDLERQPPKQRRRSNKKKKNKGALADVDLNQMLSSRGGGKAGKPVYIVQVGEVQNLYKTTKPSQQQRSHIASTLDLHGCTKEEALQRLDENLTVWEDTAMKGLYPFVIPAKIICGCGSQILSETVENWIRMHTQVANAPKNWIC